MACQHAKSLLLRSVSTEKIKAGSSKTRLSFRGIPLCILVSNIVIIYQRNRKKNQVSLTEDAAGGVIKMVQQWYRKDQEKLKFGQILRNWKSRTNRKFL